MFNQLFPSFIFLTWRLHLVSMALNCCMEEIRNLGRDDWTRFWLQSYLKSISFIHGRAMRGKMLPQTVAKKCIESYVSFSFPTKSFPYPYNFVVVFFFFVLMMTRFNLNSKLEKLVYIKRTDNGETTTVKGIKELTFRAPERTTLS